MKDYDREDWYGMKGKGSGLVKTINIWQWATRLRTWNACEICGVFDRSSSMNAILMCYADNPKEWDYWRLGSPFYNAYFCEHCWENYAGISHA